MNNSATSRLEVHDVALFDLRHQDWGLYINLAGLFSVLLVMYTTILRFPFLIFLNRGTTQTHLLQWIQRSEVQVLTAAGVALLFYSLSYENESFAVRKNEQVHSRSNKNLLSAKFYLVGTLAYLATYLIYHRNARKINNEAVEGYILPVTFSRVNFMLDVLIVVSTSVAIYCYVKAVGDQKSFVLWFTFGNGVVFGSLAVSLYSWILKARAYQNISVRGRVQRPQFAKEYSNKANFVRKYALVLFLVLAAFALISFAISYRFVSFMVCETAELVLCVLSILQIFLLGLTLESKELSSDHIRQHRTEGRLHLIWRI